MAKPKDKTQSNLIKMLIAGGKKIVLFRVPEDICGLIISFRVAGTELLDTERQVLPCFVFPYFSVNPESSF